MVTISPVHLKDAERAYEEFFRDEFRSQRLGTFGYWLRHNYLLGLENPASRNTFQNLVQGLTSNGRKTMLEHDHDPKRVALWQIDIFGSQSLSVLWAMAPGTFRGILESVHMMAAMDTLGRFEMRAVDRQQRHSLANAPTNLAVFFHYGASHDQTPHLGTTAFVLNHGFLRDGSTQKLTAEDLSQQMNRMSWFYAFAVRAEFLKLIGPFQHVEGVRDFRIVGVPQELVRRFFFDPAFSRDVRQGKDSKPLEDTELFAKWRAQGDRFGWGVNQAKAMLRETRRQKRWLDLKSDLRSKVRETAQRISDWKESWKPRAKQPDAPPQEKASRPKEEAHKHSH